MKKIKIKFVDWPTSYLPNTLLDILKTIFELDLSENPDYIFYSDFGTTHLNYDCIRIYYTAENLVPDFNICDYAIGFHHIAFEDRYLRFPIYSLFQYRIDYEKAQSKHYFGASDIDSKTKFCNFVYSNGNADKIREDFLYILNKYKEVDSGGRYKNNVGGPIADKYLFQTQYKFSIAFENSSMSGYTTEKIVQAFAARTIPIYWGDPSIDMFFNENAFINCQKFKNFDDVLLRIIEIDNDPELFLSILKEPMLKTKDIEYNDLHNFLYHIFDQGQNHFRRSNTLRGKWYQDWNKKMVKLDLQLTRVHRYLPFFKW